MPRITLFPVRGRQVPVMCKDSQSENRHRLGTRRLGPPPHTYSSIPIFLHSFICRRQIDAFGALLSLAVSLSAPIAKSQGYFASLPWLKGSEGSHGSEARPLVRFVEMKRASSQHLLERACCTACSSDRLPCVRLGMLACLGGHWHELEA